VLNVLMMSTVLLSVVVLRVSTKISMTLGLNLRFCQEQSLYSPGLVLNPSQG
jgi:hypothetical protein